jgi:uncharacterized coiled-coil protein SlyX
MLIRNLTPVDPEKWVNDRTHEKPSIMQSAYDNFSAAAATPTYIANQIADARYKESPEGRHVQNTLDYVSQENANPKIGWGQWAANEGSSMLGMMMNPITGMGGLVGGTGAKLIIGGASKIPVVGALARKPFMEAVTKGFGAAAGSMVPTSLYNNYNRDTNHINFGGVAKESFEMGGLGAAFGGLGYGAGILFGKINRTRGVPHETPVDQHEIDRQYKSGQLSEKEYKLGKDYLEYQKDPHDLDKRQELQDRFTQLAKENGHKVNSADGTVIHDFISPETVDNIQGVLPDQAASNHLPSDQRTALSNYLIRNDLDKQRETPQKLDGLKGYLAEVNPKLDARLTKLAEHDKIVDEHLHRGMKESMPLSQKAFLSEAKKRGMTHHNVDDMPVNAPKEVRDHLKQLSEIQRLKNNNKTLFKKFKKTGNNVHIDKMKDNEEKINHLKENMPPLLTPKQELTHLREKFLGKGLKHDFQSAKEYHRLTDLAEVWHNARTLLDRVHEEHEYNRQEAFRDLTKAVVDIGDSDAGALANPDNILDYLKTRAEDARRNLIPVSELNEKIASQEKIPADIDRVLAEQSTRFEKVSAEKMKDDYKSQTDKFKEFQKKDSVFKNVISCVMGVLGG